MCKKNPNLCCIWGFVIHVVVCMQNPTVANMLHFICFYEIHVYRDSVKVTQWTETSLKVVRVDLQQRLFNHSLVTTECLSSFGLINMMKWRVHDGAVIREVLEMVCVRLFCFSKTKNTKGKSVSIGLKQGYVLIRSKMIFLCWADWFTTCCTY